jgi:NifU-like protein involved in Fe-S cluster formation
MEQQVSETGERPINELNALLRRLTGDSLEEIDRVVRDLESVCDMLRNEGERVTRELASYASLSHSALMAMKVLSDSVKQWKNDPNQN